MFATATSGIAVMTTAGKRQENAAMAQSAAGLVPTRTGRRQSAAEVVGLSQQAGMVADEDDRRPVQRRRGDQSSIGNSRS